MKLFENGSEEFIPSARHKKIVNELLGATVQMNLVVAQWSQEIIKKAEQSEDENVIKFAQDSLLSLKKRMAANLLETIESHDRV